eukprot:scaffold46407_cov176-Amphora_coffeaeformis.AAC.2
MGCQIGTIANLYHKSGALFATVVRELGIFSSQNDAGPQIVQLKQAAFVFPRHRRNGLVLVVVSFGPRRRVGGMLCDIVVVKARRKDIFGIGVLL